MSTLFELDYKHVRKSAEISECGRYRWWLHRAWNLWSPTGKHITGKGVVCFVMLNPSTADASQDDPTIRRCMGFARSWGYDTLSVRNLFPFRATDPKDIPSDRDTATGGHRGNDELIAAATGNMVVVAWGASVPHNRDREALELFDRWHPGVPLYCLGKTAKGHPRHPLYVKGNTQPVLFKGAMLWE